MNFFIVHSIYIYFVLNYLYLVDCVSESGKVNSNDDIELAKFCEFNIKRGVLNCTLSSEEVDIKKVLHRMKNEEMRENFNRLIWSIPIKNGTMPSHSFSRLQFRYVKIYSPNLERIHKDAFEYSSIERLDLTPPDGVNESKLKIFNNTEHDLYQAIMNIENLKSFRIMLDNSAKHVIPDNVFEKNMWPQLVNISFVGNFTIERIGDNFLRHLNSKVVDIHSKFLLLRKDLISEIRVEFRDVTFENISSSAFSNQDQFLIGIIIFIMRV